MHTSEELAFYWKLISNMFAWKYDLLKLPGPRCFFGVGNIPHVMRPDYHVQVSDRTTLIPVSKLEASDHRSYFVQVLESL